MSETAKFLTPEQAARVDHSRFDAEKIDRPTITYWQGAADSRRTRWPSSPW